MVDAFAIGDIMQEELNQTEIKTQEKKDLKMLKLKLMQLCFNVQIVDVRLKLKLTILTPLDIHLSISLLQQ